jgi:DNA primase
VACYKDRTVCTAFGETLVPANDGIVFVGGRLSLKGVTSEVIAEVRSRANILDVVSEIVVLRNRGKNHTGLCPFHNEKTPSFTVTPEKGIYKCFGCGEGGDVFAFVQKAKGLDFLDTVRDLAHKYGVPLVETAEDRQSYDKRSLFLMLYEQAAEYYTRLLNDPAEGLIARQYLEGRGLSEDIIKRFRLGYVPSNWDGLLRYLTEANKVSASTLEEAGLVRRRSEGTGYFDLFRHRLMIPISDDQGRVIAFGGRTLGDDQIKYLNSPETPLYTKGQHLFGFHLAKEDIKAKDAVIVVEGYFDAITPHQFGFTNTVATLGTALTAQQAKMLVRYTESKRVFLSFDADAAGAKAVERGVETLTEVAQGVGIDLRVITVPGSKDPDECLRSPDGVAHFQHAIENAPVLLDHQINTALSKVNYQTHTGKIEAARHVVPVLGHIRNAVARGEYIRQTAARIGVREEELLSDVSQFRQEHRLSQQDRVANNLAFGASRAGAFGRTVALSNQQRKTASLDGASKAEQELLASFLLSREDHALASKALVDDQFISPVHQMIKDAIFGIGSSFNNVDDLRHKLMDRLAPDKEASSALIDVILKAEEMRKQKGSMDVVLLQARSKLIKERVSQLTKGLSATVSTGSDESDSIGVQSKIAELTKLERKIPNVSDMSELDDLRRRINDLAGPCQNSSQMETKV